MLLIWFLLVALMLTAYVVLDGFDLGVGVLFLFVAKNEEEKQLLIRSIGPVWDGNEVWLLAGGGTLYFAFPLLYASGFSGFYLPLMMVLWLLILRGVGVELRSHVDSPVWTGLFGGAFGIASMLLTIFYGAALGNVLRGVPLQPDHFFFLPMWTDWRTGAHPGILDWYTVLAGVVALVALSLHGATYAALKTSGDLNQRLRRCIAILWPMTAALTVISLAATLFIRPDLLDNYSHFPVLYLIPILVVASLIAIRTFSARGNERGAFMACGAYLAMLLVGAAAAVYPNLLTSSTDRAFDITVDNAHSGEHGLAIGLIWWGFGMAIAIGYFVFLYRMFRGKLAPGGGAHGY